MFRNITIIILLLFCIFLTGCKTKEDEHEGHNHGEGVETGETGHENEHEETKFITLDKDVIETIGIKTKKIQTGYVPSYLETIGEVIPNANLMVNITPITSGKVKIINVNLGDYVSKGELLATLSSPDLAKAISEYQTSFQKVQLMKENLRIKEEFASTGAYSGPPYEDKKQEYSMSKAELTKAQENLEIAQANLESATADYKKVKAIEKTGDYGKKPLEEAKNLCAQTESEYLQAKNSLLKSEEELHRAEKLYKSGIISKKELLISQTEYENSLVRNSEKEAQFEIAKGVLEREQSIYQKGVVNQSAIEGAKAKYIQAEKEYAQALAELDKTKTGLNIVNTQMIREEHIYNKNLNTSKEIQTALSDYKGAMIEYDRAITVLETYGISSDQVHQYAAGQLPIFSPIKGYILERNINNGEVVYNNTILFKVIDTSSLWIDSEIYEQDCTKINKGQEVTITTSAYPDEIFTGKIFYISNTFHEETRTFDVRTSFDNRKNLLKPGMTVNTKITTGNTQGLTISSVAVLDDDGKKVIFIKVKDKENTFEKREVKAELLKNKSYLIKEGLTAGEEVVIEGALELRAASSKEKIEGGCQH